MFASKPIRAAARMITNHVLPLEHQDSRQRAFAAVYEARLCQTSRRDTSSKGEKASPDEPRAKRKSPANHTRGFLRGMDSLSVRCNLEVYT